MGNFPIDSARPVGPATRPDENTGLQQYRNGYQQPGRVGGEEDNQLFATRSQATERTGGAEREEELTPLEMMQQQDNASALMGGSAEDRAPGDLPGSIIDILV